MQINKANYYKFPILKILINCKLVLVVTKIGMYDNILSKHYVTLLQSGLSSSLAKTRLSLSLSSIHFLDS